MNDKRRSINTRFWEDPFIEELGVSQKLLFIYLISNPLTNLMGVYEISEKRISYDTGIDRGDVKKGLDHFEKAGKISRYQNYILITNFLKNQRLNENMKKGVVNEFDKLPNSLRELILGNDSESFETIRNGMLKVKVKEKEKEEIENNTYNQSSHSGANENDVSDKGNKAPSLETKYKYFISMFNEISRSETNGRWERQFRGDAKSRRQFAARLKDGYTSKDFEKAIRKMYRDPFHKDNNYKHATPELITRPDKLEKFINIS